MMTDWMMTRFRCYLLAMVVLMTITGRVAGATTTEAQLRVTIRENFYGGLYDRAEKLCAQFAQEFPMSPHLPEEILLQARSRLEQSNYAGAMQLLVANQNVVGASKDEFVFWMGEARLR